MERAFKWLDLLTDSSVFAWGAVLNGTVDARGYWTPEEERDHITLKELRAVTRAVTTFCAQLEVPVELALGGDACGLGRVL